MARSDRSSSRARVGNDDRRSVSGRTGYAAKLAAALLLVPMSLFVRAEVEAEPGPSSGEPQLIKRPKPERAAGTISKQAARTAEDAEQERLARVLRRSAWIGVPGGSSLRKADDHEALVDAAIALLNSTTVELPRGGYHDVSMSALFSPAREITFSGGDSDATKPKTVRITRLYIDLRNVFGPGSILAEIDGKYRGFSKHSLEKWVAFRREYDRVTFRRPRPIVPAVGEWSKPVNGLQARLAVENWRDPMIGVFLELKNSADLLNTMLVPINADRIDFQLRNPEGELVPAPGFPRSGPVVTLKDFQLPYDSSLRFNLSVSTVGMSLNSNAMIALRSHVWVIPAGDFGRYELSGSFKVPRERGQNQTTWHGELQIPPVAVEPASRERVPDTNVLRHYAIGRADRPTALKMLATMFAKEDDVRFEAAEVRNQIRVTASESRYVFIDEVVQALGNGSTSHELEAKRVWLRSYQFERNHFTFVRVQHSSARQRGVRRGARWATDYPDADIGLSARLSQWTSLDVDLEGKVFKLTDKQLGSHPFIYMSEPGSLSFTDAEVVALREYLTNGGFLMADDFWGEAEWLNLKTELKRVFPELDTVDLPLSHPVFHGVFDMKEKPQVCSIAVALTGRAKGLTWERADGKEVHYRGLVDKNGRLMAVLCHNTDLADGWERQDADAWYAQEFSEKRAFPMGINIVFHALTN